ncbi:hypothetical protein AOLI_G00184370 [Acnodon oligacanthus]
MGPLALLLWTVTGAALLNPASAHRGPVVQTKLGALKGEYVTAKGKDTVVHGYLGVPFAKPPVGPLRLAPPQPAEAWEGVRDATQQPHICIQNRTTIMNILEIASITMEVPEVSEDCLYLNIYTPSTPGENTKLPVMVWIHGGGLILGGAFMQDGSVLAAYQNVVVVIIQYRLGLLGYFSTGDQHAPGNYGLLDQVAALQWVQENIHSFGGDPEAVTIFGESAGGLSVSLQILSPLSAGLFRSAIAESGTALLDMLMTNNPLPMAQQVANASGCDISSTKKMVDCVMQWSMEDILKATQGMAVSFQVTKDGQFLPKSVHELLQNKFKKVPFVVGVNDDEGGYTLMNYLASPGWIDGMNREQAMSSLPFFFPDPSEKWVYEVVLNEYLGSTDDPIKIRDGLREMYGDLMFNIPARKVAKYHKDSGAPVYLYEFQHTYSEIKKRRPSFVGSDHGDEIHFVFGSCFANAHIKISGQFTEKENELCRTVMQYWGNFARTGSPNGPGLTPWPEHGTEAEYLSIGLEQKAGKNLKGKHYTFMTETLPHLIRQKKDGPVLQTKLGALKGEYVTAKGTDTVVHGYFGVPFAKPPVGPLRLAPPQPAEAWEGVRDATQQPHICIQHRTLLVGVLQHFLMNVEIPEMSEDCLYLNVYTPSQPGKDAKLPVMVWIHGGAFTVGSASMQDGSVLAAYEDVVVVVIQYRLGLLGFFSTGDKHAPGNYGLLDQVAALQWVQENIHSFGGDPGAVTIFGESAGGVSVSLQILSPLSAGLFRSAIAESGTAAMDAIMTDNPLPIAQHLAEVSGCDISSTKKMVDCIMQLSEEDLQRIAETEGLFSVKVPKDGRFLPKSVYGLLKNKQFNKVPLITGVTDDEGGHELINFFLAPGWTDGISREQVMSIMPSIFSGPSEKWVYEVVLNEYLGTTDDPLKIRDGLREMYGDLMFNIPARKVAKYHKGSGAPVYLYEFQHTYSEIKKRPSFVGSDHGDEIHFVFGSCFTDAVKISGHFTEKENELCRTVMHYWGNFAHTGSPNGPGLTPWPEHRTEGEYLGIGLEQKAGKNLKGQHYLFMTETLPRLIREKKKGPVVQTKLGALKGEYLRVKGKDTVVHGYLGVPFAKPPVGPLRLAPPEPAEAWEGVRDATQQPHVCIQHRPVLDVIFQNFINHEAPEMSEDCLYLNIYTPSQPGKHAKLPVMVWIHGGALTVGSASMQDGSVLAAYQNVVVVLIQYRLGLLGFFSTGDEHAPGNYGLLDQVAALQWVQENIHSFGGDPGAVTIFGLSAGGVSVSLQILSPLSAGLFRSAIAASGTAAMDAIVTDNPLPIAQHLAEVSGCDISSTKKMVDCVMQLSEEDLQRVAETEGLFSVKVAKDGQFLPKSVYELLKYKQFNKVPLITGVTDDDGGYLLINAHLRPGWTDGITREQVMSIIPFLFSGPSAKWVHEVVLNEYLGSTDDPIKIRDGLREMYGDLMFNIPARKVAKYHKDSGAPVYLYEFQHTYNEIKKRRPSFVGSDHADDFHFVFGSCFANAHSRISGQFTEKENDLCRTVMAYWGNFARTGSPNGPSLTPWPEHGTEAEYLGIGLEQKAGKNLKGKHYTFMTETLPHLIREKKDGPVVQTKLGALKGEYVIAKGKETVVHSYLGVPFAKPPVGPLRLTPPQTAEAWEGVRDATQQPHICIQDKQVLADLFANFTLRVELPEMSEDCLYLNIYTPANPGVDANLPVMVWIHGGGLSMGSASIYDGSVLSAYQNVVVVLIQYRLGLLGFFSTGDEHAPGNYGLLDQVAALHWVQQNIHSFGGDPGSVTIFGESAGGASVSFLLLSPLSAGLFHRAVAQSGCATMAGIVMDPLPVAQQVANVSGCDISSTQKIAECIKQWSTEDMITLSKEHFMLHFLVTEDKAFLPKPVEELLQNQEFSKVPLLIGTNDDEFGLMIPSIIGAPGWSDGMKREQVLSSMATFIPDVNKQWINELIADEYLGSSADQIKIRDSYKEMMGDIIFNIPALKLAKFHKAAGAPVYLYQFQQPPSFIQAKRPSFVRTDHGDDIFFVFGLCFANAHVKTTASVTEKDKELCRTVMAYWGNFARTGSPNGPDLTPWPEYGAEAEYLGIGLEQKPGRNLKAKRYIFMTETLPKLVRSAQEKRDHNEL